ncbi:MAG: M48 family metalloprotease [Bacteroidota bacterium]|nr:M48 family metalloprotease [Bacteroidota bacterium]
MKTNSILLLVLLTFLFSCKSKDGDYTFFSVEEDLALGQQVAAQIESDPQQFPILQKEEFPELYFELEKIRDQLLQSDDLLHREIFAWELKVVDNDTIQNAFCTPGGYIYVYTGLIRFVESTDELAGIIAHEIAHGDLRHSTDQMTKTYGLRVLANLLSGSDAEILTHLGINLIGLKFSRGDEAEADLQAIKYLNDTDYDPKAFATFFKRMEAKGESLGPLQFLSTHPNPANRIEKIEKFWQETGAKDGKDHTAAFRSLKNSLPS